MQQHIACAIDARVQTVAGLRAISTVERLTRDDVELWLSGWCMIGRRVNRSQIRRAQFDCSRTVPEPKNVVKPLSVSRYCKPYTTTRFEKVGRYTCPLAIVGAANFA